MPASFFYYKGTRGRPRGILIESNTSDGLSIFDSSDCCCSTSTSTTSTSTSTSTSSATTTSATTTTTSSGLDIGACCADDMPTTLNAELIMTDPSDSSVCSTRNVTLTRVGTTDIWAGTVSPAWCTDPSTFDVEFRCNDWAMRVDTPSSWLQSNEGHSCLTFQSGDPIQSTFGSFPNINDSSCCSISPGELTIVLTE